MKKMYILALAICCLAMGAIAYASKGATASSSNLYGKVSAMTPAEAKAEYFRLTPSERREVWREKLTILAKSDAFTKDQTAFLTRTIDQLDNFKFDGTDDTVKLEPIRVGAIELFGKADAKAIFATMGGGSDVKAIKASLAFSDCSCSLEQQYCDNFCTNLIQCVYSEFGCGTFFVNPCNGHCR